MASLSDNKHNSGLANCLSNVFKLAEVDGLKWVRYTGLVNNTLEAPKSDPVLTSYASLLNNGYACSWRRQSPSTDGTSGEGKDLWVFYFTKLPDLTGNLAPELKEEEKGSWEDGMTPDSSAMLFRALNSLIERSLLSENFLPLGKWYARPDPSMGSDGRGCFLCSFSFFIHAHRFICASVDVRAGPALQLLHNNHLNQALSSSSGMQVILSPSGLNGIMTGHSYKSTDPGISDLLDEWKLFYPRRFEGSVSSQLPAAVEVVLGGVRLRYPSRFVFVYHTEDAIPTPPPSPLDEGMIGKVIQGGWEDTMCVDPFMQQKQCEDCSCAQKLQQRESNHTGLSNKPSRPHRLLSSGGESLSERSSRRVRSHMTSHPTDNATPMREHPAPSSLSLNTTMLNKRRTMGPPKYTTPLPSPAVTIPSSPAVKQPFSQGHVSFPPHTSAPLSSSISSTPLAQGVSPSPGSARSSSRNVYNGSRIAELMKSSRLNDKNYCDYLSFENGWWQCMDLPESLFKMYKMLHPMSHLRIGLPSVGGGSGLPPGSAGGVPPYLPISGIGAISPFTTGDRRLSSGEKSTPTTPSKKRPNSGKAMRGGRAKIPKRGNEIAAPASILDPKGISFLDDPMSIDGMESEVLHNITIQENVDVTAIGNGAINSNKDGIPGGKEMSKMMGSGIGGMGSNPLDLTSANAVKIQSSLGDLFDESDEEDSQNSTSVPMDSTDTKGPTTGNTTTAMFKPVKGIDSTLHPLDFSHIYPTPPSVESTDDRYDEGRSMSAAVGLGGAGYTVEENNDVLEEMLLSNLSPLNDILSETIPNDFHPLSNLSYNDVSNSTSRKKNLTYKPRSKKSLSSNKKTSKNGTSSSLASSSQSLKSEPQKFIFPPPTAFTNNRPNFSLPLSQSTDHASSSSPFLPTPYSSSPLRLPNRLQRPLPLSAHTPLESPFDPITPTPMSSSRLVPVLPEAHALYINLALLDSALGANVSDNVSVDMSAIQNIIRVRSTFRQRLDSVGSMVGGSTSSALIGNTGLEEDGVLKIEDEKPLMMLSIADYPSLGFKEDLVGGTPAIDSNQLLSALGLEKSGLSFDDERYHKLSQSFLSLVQDYCVHLCLTGKQEVSSVPSSGVSAVGSTTPISGSLQPYQQQLVDKQHSKEICRLYHTQSVSSAIMCGKQLIHNSRPSRYPPPPSSAGLPPHPLPTVTLDKEDNSASWILDLLSLPTKFVTKKLKELKNVFQSSFHHAPCIKVSTKGPLTLRDLQNLTSSHTPAGDECVPLPMQPLMVGCDHEWISISPLALTAWDKLMLEPYSSQKHILYLVLSPGRDTYIDTLKTFFCNLSVTYKNCKLGAHIPLDKDTWEQGIITNADKIPGEELEDKKPNLEDLENSAKPSLEKLCQDLISKYLSKLPTDNEKLLQCSTLVNETTPPKSVPVHCEVPVCIVIYVVMRRKESKKDLNSATLDIDDNVSDEVVEVMKVFSSIMANEDIPDETRNRLVIQPLEESELIGPHSNTTQHVRSLAFSVFTRCRPVLSLKPRTHHMTGFGPLITKPQQKHSIKLLSPLYILAPDPPLLPNPLLASSQSQPPPTPILFSPDECTLNCSYCVSFDRKWLLAIVCDRQAEILDSCVIGLQQSDVDGSSCRQALNNLWVYLLSIMSTSVVNWNLVITRLGKPSSTEVKEWPQIISNDGLMTANQLLSQDCSGCFLSGQQPTLKNVIFVSMQPERNIQLFPQLESDLSISHILILPPHPNHIPDMTPTDAGFTFEEFIKGDPEGEAADADPLLAGIGDDLFVGLDNWGAVENQTSTFTSGAESATFPVATGYLVSTTPPGYLPAEFWGHEKPQSVCNMFKVHLHSHLSSSFPGSPPDVLCSVLLNFDALSWLSINQITHKRNSSLPIHVFLLSKLYNFFSLLSRPR